LENIGAKSVSTKDVTGLPFNNTETAGSLSIFGPNVESSNIYLNRAFYNAKVGI